MDYSTKNKTEGTGLGLSIVKNLVELMGGTVNLKSKLGEGSTFTISLEVPMVERKDNPHMAKEAYDPAILNGRDILLVEDHPMNIPILQCNCSNDKA